MSDKIGIGGDYKLIVIRGYYLVKLAKEENKALKMKLS